MGLSLLCDDVRRITDACQEITPAPPDVDDALPLSPVTRTVTIPFHPERMRTPIAASLLLLSLATTAALAQRAERLTPDVLKYVRPTESRIVLTHVEIIDGSGSPVLSDRNITIERGIITEIAPGVDVPSSRGTTAFDLRGTTVMPGIVGMHDHLWFQQRPNLGADNSYDGPAWRVDMGYSAPRLYLAAGVTTIRTAGSAAPYTDLYLKRQIESGRMTARPHSRHTPTSRETSCGPRLKRRTAANSRSPATCVPSPILKRSRSGSTIWNTGSCRTRRMTRARPRMFAARAAATTRSSTCRPVVPKRERSSGPS